MKVQFDFNYYVGANAFLILGAWEKEAKRQGFSQQEIDKVIEKAKDGNYHHLCDVTIIKIARRHSESVGGRATTREN